ncbi:hypothetical protein DPMN_176722 [Dreissena polymorpha]|uniref:Uncharacterized protein n=1 Tax=Dreissena polymorpha TaxID=45954 RepID=A0A9D4E8U2_DREPO|nr:hypothetical protein DPMN_176722 [Dreissena polymorpha]
MVKAATGDSLSPFLRGSANWWSLIGTTDVVAGLAGLGRPVAAAVGRWASGETSHSALQPASVLCVALP